MRIMRWGQRGNDVREVQKMLKEHGYFLSVDGIFGDRTEKIVKEFQNAQGLQIDGIVGPKTYRALRTGQSHVIPLETSHDNPRQKTIDAALRDVGKMEFPKGSNKGPDIAHLVEGYAQYWGIKGNPYYPWCMMAVSVWTGIGFGLGPRGDQINWAAHPFGAWFGGVAQAMEWAKREKKFTADYTEARPGDIFVMGREDSGSDSSSRLTAGHAGILVTVRKRDFDSVDGNVSDSVGLRTRSPSDVLGFIQLFR